jgi:hypothetical protein
MATPTVDLSGLPLLENAVAQLQATQAASPSVFTGGGIFNCTYRAAPGGAPATMTIAALLARVQAILLNVQQLPQ